MFTRKNLILSLLLTISYVQTMKSEGDDYEMSMSGNDALESSKIEQILSQREQLLVSSRPVIVQPVVLGSSEVVEETAPVMVVEDEVVSDEGDSSMKGDYSGDMKDAYATYMKKYEEYKQMAYTYRKKAYAYKNSENMNGEYETYKKKYMEYKKMAKTYKDKAYAYKNGDYKKSNEMKKNYEKSDNMKEGYSGKMKKEYKKSDDMKEGYKKSDNMMEGYETYMKKYMDYKKMAKTYKDKAYAYKNSENMSGEYENYMKKYEEYKQMAYTYRKKAYSYKNGDYKKSGEMKKEYKEESNNASML